MKNRYLGKDAHSLAETYKKNVLVEKKLYLAAIASFAIGTVAQAYTMGQAFEAARQLRSSESFTKVVSQTSSLEKITLEVKEKLPSKEKELLESAIGLQQKAFGYALGFHLLFAFSIFGTVLTATKRDLINNACEKLPSYDRAKYDEAVGKD